ncbi:MAG: transcriptional regulator PpsR [Rhodovarius sp.]|nr:transcriptional regulator PpsR [Rhodovarius sp.]MCX7933503.1 transcriptional regulator PpsR [Rhodovarius sp.]
MSEAQAQEEAFRNLDPDATARLVSAAADAVFVLDGSGMIQSVRFGFGEQETGLSALRALAGSRFVDCVLPDSRSKAAALLEEARLGRARPRHINISPARGQSLAMMCAAAPAGAGHLVVCGRDLRPLTSLQQQLVEALQAVERDYARLKQTETRYRLLFQMSGEPVLLADAATLQIVETNLAAERLISSLPAAVRDLPGLFEPASGPRLSELLAEARSAGRAEEVPLRLRGRDRDGLVSASLVRQDSQLLFLLRIATGEARPQQLPPEQARMAAFVEVSPDAIVLASGEGKVLGANPSFLSLAELASLSQLEGETLGRFLGRQEVEFEVLLANLRLRGPVRLLQTVLRGALGGETRVELAAAAVPGLDQPVYGFAIRDIGARPAAPQGVGQGAVGFAPGQLAELVGHVPLRELVREATDVIEKLAIEAALELAGDNRALAAEMLGLSRQSLYVKLRRFGIGDSGRDAGDPPEEQEEA